MPSHFWVAPHVPIFWEIVVAVFYHQGTKTPSSTASYLFFFVTWCLSGYHTFYLQVTKELPLFREDAPVGCGALHQLLMVADGSDPAFAQYDDQVRPADL